MKRSLNPDFVHWHIDPWDSGVLSASVSMEVFPFKFSIRYDLSSTLLTKKSLLGTGWKVYE